MIVAGLIRLESAIRSLSWASVDRLPAPLRSGARLPWKRSSGNGPLWQSRHRPTWRFTTIARPRAGSPFAPVSERGIPSSAHAVPVTAPRAAAPGGVSPKDLVGDRAEPRLGEHGLRCPRRARRFRRAQAARARHV